MHDEHHFQTPPIPLTGEVADVLRKHLGRGTLSLDDAAILVGVPVDQLEVHFPGRRSLRGQRPEEGDLDPAPPRKRVSGRVLANEAEHLNSGLRADERSSRRPSQPASAGPSRMMWAGGIFAGVAVFGGLALLSGIPQSLLFPPRGVSVHGDANTAAAPPQPSAEIPLAEAPAPAAAEPAEAVASAEPPPVAETPPDPTANPALADPAATPAQDGAVPPAELAHAEPVPPAPEEVTPATAVADAIPVPDAAAPVSTPAASVGATLYATRQTVVRDAPTATGSATLGQLNRGDAVSGSVVAGADGKLAWLKIDDGPAAGGYVSIANMASDPRPAIVQAIGQPRTVAQTAPLHASASDTSPTLDTLNPGIRVLAGAEVEGGWIEIQKRAGGVGYIRKEALQ